MRDHRDRHHGCHDGELFDLSRLAQRLLAHKKLLVLAGVALLALIALFAVIALPLLGQAIDYVDKSGVKGLIDRLWQGAGGGI